LNRFREITIMHRATPAQTLHRSYDSGGARTTISAVDDGPQMQEMAGNFMKGESRKAIEAPQNYGFSSVVRDAVMGSDGLIESSAEGFVSFLGGNRSFPVCAVMDDRRYRLKQLAKGDVAMFDYLQHQIHLNNDGMFVTGRTDKKLKFQLVDPPQQSGNSAAGASVGTHDASSGSSGGSSSSSGSGQLTGQTQRYNQSGKQYMEMDKNSTNVVHDQAINYKTASHTFSGAEGGAATTAGGPLMTILGDKFTQGLGTFTKQVSAAAAMIPQHLVTKQYADALFKMITGKLPPSFTMPPIPGFPPSLPGIPPIPGVSRASHVPVSEEELPELSIELDGGEF
jgi:phage gp45-like